MNIAITLKYMESFKEKLFSNGLYQNIFTLYRLLKSAGYNPYICIGMSGQHLDSAKKKLKEMNYNSIGFSGKEMKENNIHVLIEAGTVVDSLDSIRNENPNMKVAALLYGNPYFPRIENIVFKPQAASSSLAAERDGMWISPHFEFCKEFVSELSGIEDVKIAPFVWSSKYLEDNFKERGLDRNTVSEKMMSSKNIAIMEPNLNILKTCIIPSMIVNRLYREHPELIESAMCFGSSDLINSKTANSLLSSLKCVKDKKLTVEARYAFDAIFSKWCGSIVSHQHFNELNYVYIEALYYNIPLIHNSPFFKDVGYFYNEFNVEEGKERLKEAILTHKYRSKAKKDLEEYYINKYLDTNQDNIDGYKKLIEDLF